MHPDHTLTSCTPFLTHKLAHPDTPSITTLNHFAFIGTKSPAAENDTPYNAVAMATKNDRHYTILSPWQQHTCSTITLSYFPLIGTKSPAAENSTPHNTSAMATENDTHYTILSPWQRHTCSTITLSNFPLIGTMSPAAENSTIP